MPYRAAALLLLVISSHHTKHVENPSSITMRRRGGQKQVDGNQHENPELAIFNSRRMASYLMMDMMCKTLKTPSRRFFILDYLHHCCMEYCVFVIAPTIDIETAPLTPSIARRFTSARSGDSWCRGLVHVIRVHLVADFGDVSAVSRCCFSLSVLDGDCFSSSSTWSLAFLRADTQAWALRVELHFWRFSASNCPGSPAWRAWMGGAFPAASVSCSAIMHWTPLNETLGNPRTSINYIVLLR